MTDTIDPERLQPAADLLVGTGLLWAINRYVFHPRGFALMVDPDTGEMGLAGDGVEVWRFTDEMDQAGADQFDALLDQLRAERRRDL